MGSCCDDSDARDSSLRRAAQGLPKVTACGLPCVPGVSVAPMKHSRRGGHALVLLCLAGAATAAEPLLPRESTTLAGRDAEPLERAELTLAGADDAGRSPNFLALPVRGRSGVQALLSGGEADGLRWQLGGIALAQRESRFDLDGTSLSLPLGPGRLYASVERRHWGPSPFGSLILDGAARAMPAAGWRKTSGEAFAWPGLAWLGPWRTDMFAAQLRNELGPGGVKLLGWRLEIEPLHGLVLGGARTIQWGGDGRTQTLGSLLRGIAGLDNFETHDRSAEPGNQLAGFDLRWTLPWGGRQRFSLHGQFVGEDEAGHMPSLYLASGGGELATALPGGLALRLFGELADTTAGRAFGDPRPGIAYRHPLYPAGYTNRNEPLAHPAGPDLRIASLGLAARQGAATVRLMAHRGSAARRGFDADVQLAFPDGPAIGLAFTQWRDPRVRERGLQLRMQIPIERVRSADLTPAARSAWRAGSS